MNPTAKKFANKFEQNQSSNSRQKINKLLNEVSQLTDVEKLQFYLNLPTGVQQERRESDPNPRTEIVEASNWIRTHLQPDQELCLPKHEVYEEYTSYCDKHDIKSVGKEDLGKLMRTIYPSVTGRRLGTRGQTKHCYGGLTKRPDLESPLLPKVGTEESQQSNKLGIGDEDPNNKTEMVKASSSLICEWAEKLLSQPFRTINDIAEHLVRKSYVNCSSVSAYTVMSQVPKFNEDNKLQEAAAAKSSTQTVLRQNSSNPRNAKHQLQLKLQEKERLKEQKKKLEEQRCAITGETPKPDETNSGSADTTTVSYEASVSSDNASNQGNGKTVEIKPMVPKSILPKPAPLCITASTMSQQPLQPSSLSSNTNNQQPQTPSTPTTLQKQQLPPTVNPLLIVSPSQNSGGQLGNVFLVSPLNPNQQIIVPIQTASGVNTPITSSTAAQIASDGIGNNNMDNINQESCVVTQPNRTESIASLVTDTVSMSSVETSSSSNVESTFSTANQQVTTQGEFLRLDTNEKCKALLKALNIGTELHKGNESNELLCNPTSTAIQLTENGSRNVNSPGTFQRSQSLPAGLVNAANVINPFNLLSDNLNSNITMTENVVQEAVAATGDDNGSNGFKKNIKKEGLDRGQRSADIQQNFLWNFPMHTTSDSEGQSEIAAIALQVGTVDCNTMSNLGLQTNSNSEDGQSVGNSSMTSIQSPLQSPQQPVTPGQANRSTLTRKGQSKTVSSLLKEQRVKVENTDVGGKNRYVNDNRPVAQLLKEMREKQRLQNLSTGAMQNLSFAEESTPKEMKEHSVKSLKEKIAREASVMKKVQALNSTPKVGKQNSNRAVVKSEQNGMKSPRVGSPISPRLVRKGSQGEEGSNHGLTNRRIKTHQVALRNLLNQKRPAPSILREQMMIQDNNNGEKISGQLRNALKQSEDTSPYKSKKENAFLKKYLENGLNDVKSLSKQRSYSKKLCADMNPTLAKLLADNNNEPKDLRNQSQDSIMAGLFQSLNNNSKKPFNTDTYSFTNTEKQKAFFSGNVQNSATNSSWNVSGPEPIGYIQDNTTVGGNSNSGSGFHESLSNSEIIDLAISQIQDSAHQHSRSSSSLETTTAFMPIHQGISEANIVSPIKPQAVVPGDNSQSNRSQLLSSGSSMNTKLKELLSASRSDSNDSSEVCNSVDWLPRQNSSFVPYSQNFTIQTDEQIQPVGIGSNDCFNITNGQQVNDSDIFQQQTNQSTPKRIKFSTNNDGFACMDGVRPPSKRGLDPETQAFLSKRSRHLSDQTNIRSRRGNIIMPPLQPLIPQNRTPSHESLTPMASPASSQGYGQCPAESPFSPEVQSIMSNTNDFYNEFNNPMVANNFRSMSVPVQNFMQNEVGDYGMVGNYMQGGNQMGSLQDASQLGSMQEQYMNMPQQQYNNMGYQQHQDPIVDNNSAVYSNAKRNLMQILESRLASANFGEAAQQNLRGDHMISGASVKPTQKMRHKLGETLNSVMIHNPNGNNNVRYCNPPSNNVGQFNMPHPTPPASHPPTPEYVGDLSEQNHQLHPLHQQQQHHHMNHLHQQQQQNYSVASQISMGVISGGSTGGCGVTGMAQVPMDTPTSLEAMGSQESAESSMGAADQLFGMCDETGDSGADMPDFLRIL